NAELDELRRLASDSKEYLITMQARESEITGIPVKIGFNNIFGYYLEVTNKYKNQVPQSWIRKQTMTGGERYITDELKQYEEKILGAEEKIISIEANLFSALVNGIFEYLQVIQHNARLIAKLDCLLSF